MSGCKGEEEIAGDSFDLQRRHGWNLGAEEKRLFFRRTSSVDATGSSDWKRYTDPSRLMEALAAPVAGLGALYGADPDAGAGIGYVAATNSADFFPGDGKCI